MQLEGTSIPEFIRQFIVSIRRGHISGSLPIAIETVKVLRKVIAHGKWHSFEDLISLLKSDGKIISLADCHLVVIGNMVRRVVKLMRDEQAKVHLASSEEGSHTKIFTKFFRSPSESAATTKVSGEATSGKKLRVVCIDVVSEFLSELENCRETVVTNAAEHIQSGDTVLTVGQSTTVAEIVKFQLTAKRRNLRLFVVSSGLANDKSRGFAESLRQSCAKLEVTVVSQADLFSVMPSVSKVVVGAAAVFTDGSLKAVCGAHNVALAAARFSIPFIVTTVSYKLTPMIVYSGQDAVNFLGSPNDLIDFAEGPLVAELSVENPIFDYIPADLVTLYITNVISGNAPSYVYGLINDLYDAEDEIL